MTTAMVMARGFVVGVTRSLALRRIACAVAGLVRGTTSGWGSGTWPQER